jgi:hypothetical protein
VVSGTPARILDLETDVRRLYIVPLPHEVVVCSLHVVGSACTYDSVLCFSCVCYGPNLDSMQYATNEMLLAFDRANKGSRCSCNSSRRKRRRTCMQQHALVLQP